MVQVQINFDHRVKTHLNSIERNNTFRSELDCSGEHAHEGVTQGVTEADYDKDGCGINVPARGQCIENDHPNVQEAVAKETQGHVDGQWVGRNNDLLDLLAGSGKFKEKMI